MAQQVFRQGRFRVIDVTDKPIETIADEIIAIITRQAKQFQKDNISKNVAHHA